MVVVEILLGEETIDATSKQLPSRSCVFASSVIGDTMESWLDSRRESMRFRLELWVNSTEESTKRTYLVDTSAKDLWICSAAVRSLG